MKKKGITLEKLLKARDLLSKSNTYWPSLEYIVFDKEDQVYYGYDQNDKIAFMFTEKHMEWIRNKSK